jgi:hypothetical protein
MWLISLQYNGVMSDNDYDNAIITLAARRLMWLISPQYDDPMSWLSVIMTMLSLPLQLGAHVARFSPV